MLAEGAEEAIESGEYWISRQVLEGQWSQHEGLWFPMKTLRSWALWFTSLWRFSQCSHKVSRDLFQEEESRIWAFSVSLCTSQVGFRKGGVDLLGRRTQLEVLLSVLLLAALLALLACLLVLGLGFRSSNNIQQINTYPCPSFIYLPCNSSLHHRLSLTPLLSSLPFRLEQFSSAESNNKLYICHYMFNYVNIESINTLYEFISILYFLIFILI